MTWGFQKKQIFIIIVKGAVKLWPFKIGGKTNSNCLQKSQTWLIKGSINPQFFFRPPTLIGHNSAAPWAMIMYSSSFESHMLNLFWHYLENSITTLFSYVILAQSNLKSNHKMEIDQQSLDIGDNCIQWSNLISAQCTWLISVNA